MRIGVLSLQGDFARHTQALLSAGVEAAPIRYPEDLDAVDAAIIPGGESTTIGMLCERFGLLEAFRLRIDAGMPVLGTCAGAILLADDIVGSDQPRIGSLDISIRRNAYGRQKESFEADVFLSAALYPQEAATVGGSPASPEDRHTEVRFREKPQSGIRENEDTDGAFRGVFIRAPRIASAGGDVEVIGRLNDEPVLVRHNHIWAATFHPELTSDTRIHRAFAEHVVRTLLKRFG
ncbi:MAG: pyridoxal 5'-phosphate synthase glutaminase subunit PdxT [Spirochaetia bacterium]